MLGLHYNHDNGYFIVNRKEIYTYKANNKNVNFPTQLCLGSIPNGFGAAEFREISLKGNLYDFLVDCNAIDEFDILNIPKHLMVKKNRK